MKKRTLIGWKRASKVSERCLRMANPNCKDNWRNCSGQLEKSWMGRTLLTLFPTQRRKDRSQELKHWNENATMISWMTEWRSIDFCSGRNDTIFQHIRCGEIRGWHHSCQNICWAAAEATWICQRTNCSALNSNGELPASSSFCILAKRNNR